MAHDYTGPELCGLTAVEAVAALEKGEVSRGEMIDAALARIAQVEPAVNAMPTLCEERARARAAALERRGDDVWLAGLPIAIKDLTPVEGVRTTWGTRALAEFVPDESDPLVERLEERGAIVLGKTNTPEMGAGGNTFNEVFGPTLNPWDNRLNAAGSSGGAAVALATGEVWLAHGSDLGGSLRTPAAYAGVVGLRPSPGRAGGGGKDYAFSQEGVQGPMARTAEDCALFLDAMTGFDPRQPLTFDAPAESFLSATRRAEPPKRIAFSPDLGGYGPVEADVRRLMSEAMTSLEGLGTDVVAADPPMAGLDETYLTLRAMVWAAGPMQLPEAVTRHFKQTLRENAEQGLALTTAQIIAAQRRRSSMYLEVEAFMRDFDAIACPVVGIGALPQEVEWVREVDGRKMDHYMQWLGWSFLASTLGLPAISVPIGFADCGAPMGIQFIGRPRGEAGLLQIAKVMESLIPGFGKPIDPVVKR